MNHAMKRNAKEIAAASGSRCYNRAMSTMRLALGYRTGLPKGWPYNGTVSFRNVVKSLTTAFPKHNVYLCVSQPTCDMLIDSGYQQSRVRFEPSVLDLVTEREDDFLWAFQYEGKKDGHIVLGVPWDENGNVPLRYGYVIGVQIKNTRRA